MLISTKNKQNDNDSDDEDDFDNIKRLLYCPVEILWKYDEV